MSQIFTYIITLAVAAFLGVNAQGEAKSHRSKEQKEQSRQERKERKEQHREEKRSRKDEKKHGKSDADPVVTPEITPKPPEVVSIEVQEAPKSE